MNRIKVGFNRLYNSNLMYKNHFKTFKFQVRQTLLDKIILSLILINKTSSETCRVFRMNRNNQYTLTLGKLLNLIKHRKEIIKILNNYRMIVQTPKLLLKAEIFIKVGKIMISFRNQIQHSQCLIILIHS